MSGAPWQRLLRHGLEHPLRWINYRDGRRAEHLDSSPKLNDFPLHGADDTLSGVAK
jgi:hypothetical protein